MLTRLTRRRLDWSSLPVHPLLLSAFFSLFLFAENAEQQVTLNPLWLPLGICLAVGLVVTIVLSAIFRDRQRGALLASLLLILFFSFGHVWNLIAALFVGRWVLAIPCALVAVAGTILIWRGGRWVAPAGRFLNVVAVLLVAFNVLRVANYASVSSAAAQSVAAPGELNLSVGERGRPDIYYIILDRYANADTLRDLYGYDNEPFLSELEARGFAVARHAWANYFKTALSVYSSLSMEHIDKARLGETEPPYTFTSIYAALRDHLAVPAALKSIGYDYIHLGNWWEPTSTNVDADVVLRYQDSAEFSSALLSTTAWSLISPPADSGGADETGETIALPDLARATTLYTIDRLKESAQRPGPTFVFAHILLPHPPYVFDADGSPMSPADTAKRPERANYVRQLEYTNDRVLEVVDTLLSQSDSDPVIILQADEGPWPQPFADHEVTFQWLSATPGQIREKFGILNAVHLPGIDPADYDFGDRTSPVNEFRIVFNAIFDSALPLRPDVTYLSPNYGRMYDFVRYPHD
jgi:hypothetical protein